MRGDSVTVEVIRPVQQAMNLRTAEVVERNRLFRRIDTLGTRPGRPSPPSVTCIREVEGWIGESGCQIGRRARGEGQRLYTLYSRELVNMQDEFLQAMRSGQNDRIRPSASDWKCWMFSRGDRAHRARTRSDH
jgi:membrane fusion protein, copper/silver efflux system